MTREEIIKGLNLLEDNMVYFDELQNDKGTWIDVHKLLFEAIEVLEQEPCEDCISRKAVLDYFEQIKKEYPRIYTAIEVSIRLLPSVTPKPKAGHWIEKDGLDGDTYYDCSECGESWTTIDGTPWNNGMKYCPNCGAKMESEVPT